MRHSARAWNDARLLQDVPKQPVMFRRHGQDVTSPAPCFKVPSLLL